MEERGKEILQELKEIKELLRIIASNTEPKEVEFRIDNIADNMAIRLKQLREKNFGKD